MALPTDTLFSSQWHLRNPTAGLLDLNVTSVWNDYTGDGVYVAVMDDGLQHGHYDLSGNYSTARDWDFRGNDGDPTGVDGNNHGTAVAGIIAADRDGAGAVGVAYGATLLGYRLTLDGEPLPQLFDTFLEQFVQAVNYSSGVGGGGAHQADIVNMSLGIGIGGNFYDIEVPDQSLVSDSSTALDNAVAQGRDGLGTILVKSAGNSRSSDFDSNVNTINAHVGTIVVAAVDQDGFISNYSTHGSNLLVSAFGTPGEVVTTDRLGSEGYSNGDHTSTFNGTSSAAPMVSGVIALMLEANPNLGWRDVQEILAYSARHVGSDVGAGTSSSEEYAWEFNNAETWNGGGLHFSRDYGFGLVDAHAAVRLAETWGSNSRTSANQSVAFEDLIDRNETIDGTVNGGNTTSTVGSESYRWLETTDLTVEQVTLELDFETTWLGDIEITITSPAGTTHQIINDIGSFRDFDGRWTYATNAFWGENSAGQWSITLTDDASGDEWIVSDLDFRAFGALDNGNDTYVYTNEYSDYDGLFGHVTSVADTNGGNDTVNAAAVTSDSRIFLNGATSVIDGVSTTFSGIENAEGGDGNDLLVGNTGANFLRGGRGNDIFNGGLGNDIMVGGAGNDTYAVDSALDQVIEVGGFAGGVDTIIAFESFSIASVSSVERLNIVNASGNAQATGNSSNNVISAGSGNNLINGGAGNDLMIGGEGNDTYYVTELFDFVQEFAGGGTDRTISWVDFRLQQHVERLDLFGSANIYGIGNHGENVIAGNSGNNSINGLGGSDLLTGGAGFDNFGFNTALGATNRDIITDFNAAEDSLILENAVFTGLSTGRLDASLFHSGSIFTADADDSIVYDPSNGWVYFDTNGANAGGYEIFVNVGAGAGVTHTDFFVV